ncbi:hypothetical protein VTH82DRAFT_4584 [Thermothelomyces myriococcoides]
MLSSTPPTYGRERPVPETGQDKDEQVITFSSPSSKDSEVSHDAVATQENNKNLTSGLPFSKARCIGLTATLTGASFLNSMSGQATVIILPAIGRDLGIPESRLQWILSAYSLSFGCFLLFWGRVADIYGKREIFIAGSAWFAATTLVNPFLPNEIAFDLFRGFQGLGAAASIPTAIGILGTTFPPSKAKNYAFSCYAAGAPLGAVFGNILAGIIAEYVSWKGVFIGIALLAFAVTAAGVFVIPPSKRDGNNEGAQTPTVDWLGAVLITGGLLALLLALTEGNVVGWKTPWISVVIVISVMLVALFVFWQHHLEKTGNQAPILKVSNFRNPQFSAAMVTMALFFSSFNGFLVYATYFYQQYQGHSSLNTTLRFLPTGISGSITAAVVSQLLARVPTYLLMTFGNFFVSLSVLLFAVPIPPDTTYWAWSFPAQILSDQALGGALVNAMGQVGRAIGLAVATAIQTAVMADERGVSVEEAGSVEVGDWASLRGLRAAEWWNFGLGISALAVVLISFRGTGIVGKTRATKPSDMEGSEITTDGSKKEQAAAS